MLDGRHVGRSRGDRASRGRDAAGLEALYDRYATLVYSLALRIVRNTSDAEDVTQEAFAQVWAHGEAFDAAPRRGAGLAERHRAQPRAGSAPALGDGAAPARAVADGLDAIPDPAPSVELMAASAEQVVGRPRSDGRAARRSEGRARARVL